MPDITMCSNQQCPQADSCWRFGCPPAAQNQYYQDFQPKQDDEDGFMCDFFIEYPPLPEITPQRALSHQCGEIGTLTTEIMALHWFRLYNDQLPPEEIQIVKNLLSNIAIRVSDAIRMCGEIEKMK